MGTWLQNSDGKGGVITESIFHDNARYNLSFYSHSMSPQKKGLFETAFPELGATVLLFAA